MVMHKCDMCGTMILFGGVSSETHRFCNAECKDAFIFQDMQIFVEDEHVEQMVQEIYHGNCPNCNGPGPVDIRIAYSIWSLLRISYWYQTPHMVCRKCGVWKNIGGFLFSFFLGWWSLFGIFITPFYLVKNILAMFSDPAQNGPTKELYEMSRALITQQVAEHMATERQEQLIIEKQQADMVKQQPKLEEPPIDYDFPQSGNKKFSFDEPPAGF